MVVFCVALALTLWLRFAPDTPMLLALRCAMVEAPVRRLAQLERHHIIFLMIFSVMMLAGGELFLFFDPEFLALFATNLALYADAMAVTALLSAATVARSTLQSVPIQLDGWRIIVMPTLRRRVREVKTRLRATEPTADNDGEPAHVLRALAA